MQKRLMHIQPPLVANGQPTVTVHPGKRALHHPSVPTQPLAALYASAGYPWNDAPVPQCFPAHWEVISFVRVELDWSPAAASPTELLLDRADRIHYFNKHLAIVNVSSRAYYRKRDSLPVDHNMALRARFSLIRRIRADCFAPFLAAMLAESTAARDQSILPASPSLSNTTWCSRSHTPACCQSRSRRQHVMPLPQPISGGSNSHGKPVLSTKMIPVSAARFGMRGRPPFGLSGSGGSSGSITSHNSSVRIGLAMPYSTNPYRF
jgi:hypothetical protein